jgi:hypothetical protein
VLEGTSLQDGRGLAYADVFLVRNVMRPYLEALAA